VMDYPIDGGCGSHGILEDPVPLWKDQVWGYAQRAWRFLLHNLLEAGSVT